ncbi:hypothetical protein M422DRAFT_271621 [Sphaerobolus stellatus SS14]|uniref:Zn(2)-C6 fungal-type domain-containing protein n=1 Tax=Sphaerobolus stellatus (strain SS14) TaxID=990650 RepID=A0A0C9TZL3_SPHS4|nr:hypothetical protein M422DRAFT_271621 [Sphaerobolus stellatus SS14]
MSVATSSSKPTTTTAILYKTSKDAPHLPLVEKWDLTKIEGWLEYLDMERETMITGYWRGYDKEHDELEEHYVALVRKEAKEEIKWKSKVEKKKKKSKPTVPVASGSGKNKGKGKAEEVVDSESETDTEFQETCVGCEQAKVKCVFMHATNGKKVACDRCVHHKTNCTYQSLQDLVVWVMLKNISKSLINLDVKAGNRNHLEAKGIYHRYHLQMLDGLQWSLDQLMKADELDLRLQTLEQCFQDSSSVSEDLQNGIFHSRACIIERYNKVTLTCGAQMKQFVARYKLGKSCICQGTLLDFHPEYFCPELPLASSTLWKRFHAGFTLSTFVDSCGRRVGGLVGDSGHLVKGICACSRSA